MSDAAELQQYPSERAADGGRQRYGNHEARGGGSSPRRGEPLAQIEDDSRKEARFREAQKKPQPIELRRGTHQHHAGGEQPPRDENDRDPAARAHARQDQVARYFEQRVAEKEDPGAEAEGRGAESQFGVHLQGGDADVGAVEDVEDVEQEQERQQGPADNA